MGIFNDAKEFLSTDFNKSLTLSLLLLGLALLFYSTDSPDVFNPTNEKTITNTTLVLDFFYSPTCVHCKAQMPFNAQLEQEFNRVVFVNHDITTTEGMEKILTLYKKHDLDTTHLRTPTTDINDIVVIGNNQQEIRDAVIKKLKNMPIIDDKKEISLSTLEIDLPFIGNFKPGEYSLPILAVILGLIDGFNPCAMWVLVYLISIIIMLKDKTRLWLIVGSFIAASGILYFLFMTAWLQAFLFIGYFRPVTIIIGCVALGGGILSVKEFLQNPSGTLECKVTNSEDRKKTMNTIDNLIHAPMTWATIIGIIALAFAINSVEFVCSAAIPAVFTQVLALSGISTLEHYLYITLYVFFFMFDDLIIFGLAAFAISTDVGQKYAGYCHIIGGIIMLILGIMLLFFPTALG